MKRLHQLLAGLMAVAMVTTMTVVPAFADGETTGGDANQTQEQTSTEKTYTYSSKGYLEDKTGITYLPVTSIYGSKGPGLRPVGEFVYTLTAATNVAAGTVDADKYVIQNGLNFKTDSGTTNATSVTATFASTSSKESNSSETQTVKIDLSKLDITSSTTGVYRYTLTQKTVQTNANKDNTYADDVTYTVDLYVNGGKITYIKVWDKDNKKAYPSFQNTIVNEDILYVTHFIDDDLTPAGYTFTVQVTIPDAGIGEGGITLDVGTPVYGTVTNTYTGDTRDVTFYVVKDGQTVYTDENGEEHDNTVQMADGEKLVIDGLPVNMKYTVAMTDANKDGYSSTVKDYKDYTSDTKSGWSKYDKLETTADNKTDLEGKEVGYTYTNNLGKVHHVEYVSTRNIASTGVTMDTVPYAVMFLAAAGLVVLSLAKKKINR